MGFNRDITSQDITTHGVIAAPDTMTGTAAENKAVFDRLITNVVKEKHNALIDDLEASTSASNLGFAATEEIDEDNIQDAIEFLYENETAGVAKAQEYALKSEGHAVGKQNGVDVASGSPYYHNNAKYYSEQADNSATSASGSASTATTKAGEASQSATAAESYKSDAYTYMGNALSYKNDAETAKTGAETARTGAETAESNAQTHETNAGTSASQASGSATNSYNYSQNAYAYKEEAKSYAEQLHYPVCYGAVQSLTDSEKAVARGNIASEGTINKTTEISGLSSDTQYPSAKAVWDDVYTPLNEDKADRADVLPLINIWDEQWEYGYYNEYGVKVYNTYYVSSKNLIPVKPSTTYYYHTTSGENGIAYFTDEKAFINGISLSASATFTTPANAYYMGFFEQAGSYGNNVSINYPSTYHGYYPSALPKEIAERKDEDFMITMDGFISPTINGVKNYWDGSLYHRRIARVDLGSLNWTKSNDNRADAHVPSIKPCTTDKIVNAFMLGYSAIKYNDAYSTTSNYEIAYDPTGIGYIAFFIQGGYTNKTNAQIQSMFSGKFLYYELATEQTCNIDANGLRFELLWENASPSASFEQQSISLDLSKYKFVAVEIRLSTDDSDTYTNIIPINAGIWGSMQSTNANAQNIRRTATASSSGIGFSSGFLASSYGTYSSNNDYCIPYKIWGVR